MAFKGCVSGMQCFSSVCVFFTEKHLGHISTGPSLPSLRRISQASKLNCDILHFRLTHTRILLFSNYKIIIVIFILFIICSQILRKKQIYTQGFSFEMQVTEKASNGLLNSRYLWTNPLKSTPRIKIYHLIGDMIHTSFLTADV